MGFSTSLGGWLLVALPPRRGWVYAYAVAVIRVKAVQ